MPNLLLRTNSKTHKLSVTVPNRCAKEFGAVLDGSPMTNVDNGIESCREKMNKKSSSY